MPKKIKISSALVLDLKSEIQLAQKNSKDNRPSLGSIIATSKQKLEPSNKGIDERIARDSSGTEDPKTLSLEQSLDLSKKSLLKKSKIYQQLLEAGINTTNNNFLTPELEKYAIGTSVDFESKAISSFIKDSKSENLIETTDEFGRTRMVKKSLALELEASNNRELISNDMQIEIDRNKWENDMKSNASKNEHFDDRNETRNKAVGFYRLSQNEETRESQLKQLNELRQNTLEKQKNKIPISERRAKLLELQKKKILDRKRKLHDCADNTTFQIDPKLNDQIEKLFDEMR
ncbi:hypothetical protein BB561_005447 [Smittium simulii]|uniref:Uncharacterized protein n=1 Tax=Smittium simulii TaxID=133385 RepID=A0A2T9YAF5_9FUNG|nr:hypothetical protein BB561_005447 [Smittium simulii]